jgi:Cu(I)/Ag(I) efflux system membrane fusion protein
MTPVLEAYFAFVSALANDDAVRATSSFESMREKAAAVDVHSFPGESHDRLVPAIESVKEALPADSPKDIASQRAFLASLAKPIGNYLTSFGHEYDSPLFEIFCPMAFGGKGALWYQKAREINNPYFGASMLRCGEIKRELSSNPGKRL